ncbi:sulfatase [Galbibacter mesophilus]|uniref:sulfatase n=1 Tax=Galbibacter mesophilus TaxID=379069 RepID=UPI00191E7C61|nr:sulfatase [Galbibacter mesophilus]MCM5663392.1 sulfatase [Galbibacter mesophilus]
MHRKKSWLPKLIRVHLLLMIILGYSCSKADKKEDKQYNVLFIMADDLNASLSCYGEAMAETPHLDSLASKGTKFTQAHCQFPLCGPSRVSIMTGLRPDTTKVWVNTKDFRTTIPSVETLPQYFKNRGYKSARVGKIFHYGVPSQIGTNGLDDSISWTERVNPKGYEKKLEDSVINYTPNHGLGLALAYHADGSHKEKHTDELVVDEAIELMKKFKNDPFFLAVGFFRPHTPYIAPKEFFDLYDLNDIEVANVPENDLEDVPNIAIEECIKKYGGQNLNSLQQKEIKRAYYACVSFIDAQVGKLLSALEENGLKDNTIIVFTSDHGYNLGEHNLWEKMNLFEEATRVPLIVYLPNATQPKELSFAELIDLYPTLAEANGFKGPSYLQGQSLLPLLQGKEKETEGEAITAVARSNKKSTAKGKLLSGKSIRTPSWRYTEWNKGEDGTELYNKIEDPKEYINLSQDTVYNSIKSNLQKKLNLPENN